MKELDALKDKRENALVEADRSVREEKQKKRREEEKKEELAATASSASKVTDGGKTPATEDSSMQVDKVVDTTEVEEKTGEAAVIEAEDVEMVKEVTPSVMSIKGIAPVETVDDKTAVNGGEDELEW